MKLLREDVDYLSASEQDLSLNEIEKVAHRLRGIVDLPEGCDQIIEDIYQKVLELYKRVNAQIVDKPLDKKKAAIIQLFNKNEYTSYIRGYLTNPSVGVPYERFETVDIDDTVFEGVNEENINELYADIVGLAINAVGFADAYNMLNV